MDQCISKNDKSVLHMILNPNLPLEDDEDASDTTAECSNPDLQFDRSKLEAVKELERQGVEHAEAERFNDALTCFNQAIDILPERASGYNNRAQSKRLAGDVTGAIEDLDTAISLSGGRGKVASLAFVQRALIRRLQGDTENAKEDLENAAALGNGFAKQQLVQLNPYAALCNQMLGKVIGDLQKGNTQP